MNRKLWSEAREIAGRHARGDGDDLAQDLMVAALERGATAENPGAWLERPRSSPHRRLPLMPRRLNEWCSVRISSREASWGLMGRSSG
jgi:hypothetical protein